MKRIKQLWTWLKEKMKALKKELGALYLAYKRPDVPWYAKAVAIIVVGYALSPIDLIPDFIPVLGYLDDLILIPLGIALAIRFIPKNVIAECRTQADEAFKDVKKSWIAGLIIIIIWLLIIGLVLYKVFGLFK